MATDQIKSLSIAISQLEDEICDKLAKLQNLMIKQRDFLCQQISIVEKRSDFIQQEILREQKNLIDDKAKAEEQKKKRNV